MRQELKYFNEVSKKYGVTSREARYMAIAGNDTKTYKEIMETPKLVEENLEDVIQDVLKHEEEVRKV